MKEKIFEKLILQILFSLTSLLHLSNCSKKDDPNPNVVDISLYQNITIPPSSAFPYERSILENFVVQKGHLYDLRSTLDAQKPTDKVKILDDYLSYATNATIDFSGFLRYGQTSDHWAYLSGIF